MHLLSSCSFSFIFKDSPPFLHDKSIFWMPLNQTFSRNFTFSDLGRRNETFVEQFKIRDYLLQLFIFFGVNYSFITCILRNICYKPNWDKSLIIIFIKRGWTKLLGQNPEDAIT